MRMAANVEYTSLAESNDNGAAVTAAEAYEALVTDDPNYLPLVNHPALAVTTGTAVTADEAYEALVTDDTNDLPLVSHPQLAVNIDNADNGLLSID